MKTAIHGGDPNWGRLVAVAGRSGAAFSLERRGGADRAGRAVRATARRTTNARRKPPSICKERTSTVEVDLGTGGAGRSTMWTCDLSAEYVRINAEYRT